MKATVATPRTSKSMDELLKQEDMSVAEAADVLRVSKVTVYELLKQKQLTAWRKTATQGTRVYTSSVIKYIKEVQKRAIGNGHPKK